MNPSNSESAQPAEILDIRDLLDGVQTESLSDYLTLSISNDGHDTTVSLTTTAAQPETFTAILHSVAASSLQSLLHESALINAHDPSS